VHCRYLQIRWLTHASITDLAGVISLINDSEVKAVDILVASPGGTAETDFQAAFCSYVRANRKIRGATVHGCAKDAILQPEDRGFGITLAVREKFDNVAHCGAIHHSYFSPTVPTFTESLAHNSCLNRKIAIDAGGAIRNCPSLPETYGHIRDTTLAEAVEKPGFKKYWNITKDQIAVCRDCEFRHICTGCRAYREAPDDLHSKPLKCGYMGRVKHQPAEAAAD